MKFVSTVSDETMGFMLDGISYAAGTFRSRAGGSHTERDAAEYMASQAKPFCEQTATQTVSYRPGAYRAAPRLSAVLMTASAVLFYLSGKTNGIAFPVTSLVFASVALCVFIYEFIFSRRFTDLLYRRAEGRNVVLRRSPYAEARKKVIITANIDTSPEWRFAFSRFDICKLFSVLYIFVSAVFCVMLLVFTAQGAPSGGAWTALQAVQLLFAAVYVPMLFFFGGKTAGGGRIHNLSGCYACLGVMRTLDEQGGRLSHTEVECVLCSGGFSGGGGAREYIKGIRAAVSADDTYVIALDALCGKGVVFPERDGANTVKCSPELRHVLLRAAKRQDNRAAHMPVRSSPAVPFAHAGMRTAFIRGDAPRLSSYPGRGDTADKLSAAALSEAVKTVIEALNIIDGGDM